MLNNQPLIALTMGDAAGVGPEVIIRAWGDRRVHACCRPFVIGHPEILRRALKLVGSTGPGATGSGLMGPGLTGPVVEMSSPDDMRDLGSKSLGESIFCLRAGNDAMLDVTAGATDARTGQGAFDAIKKAVDLALDRRVDAIVTAPLCKQALQMAGHLYPGHTELLAEHCGVGDFAMMLYLPPGDLVRGPAGLSVVHVTLHMALRDVFTHLSIKAVEAKCRLADRAMRDLGVARPRIGVCALNPHAGESGLFGDEEQTTILPAVDRARAAGMHVTGPLPADTIFPAAKSGAFDAVVAIYHDQGHIALKTLGMHSAVNVTLGLPIIRTSVAHGTAFDRAWQGSAESTGMVAAITTAARLARSRGCTTG